MKFRGPASSLRPAREAARGQERAHRQQHTNTTTGISTVHVFDSPAAPRVGDWTLTTDDAGRLVAEHPDGTRTVLATPEGGA